MVWDGLAFGLIHVARVDSLEPTTVTKLLREDHAAHLCHEPQIYMACRLLLDDGASRLQHLYGCV